MGLGRIIGVYIVSAFKKERAFQCYGVCRYFSGSLYLGKCSAREKDRKKLEMALAGRICVNPKQGKEAWEARQKWLNTPSRPYYPPNYDPHLGEL